MREHAQAEEHVVTIERPAAADYAAILEINEAAVPHVNSISPATLADLASQAFYFRVARERRQIAGFLLALSHRASYRSPNFLWFRARYSRFVYVDRVVVSFPYRRLGIGRGLYGDLARAASGVAPALACEVNVEPPNPGSLTFHQGFGFAEVGRQHTDCGKKLVSLMLKQLSPPNTAHGC